MAEEIDIEFEDEDDFNERVNRPKGDSTKAPPQSNTNQPVQNDIPPVPGAQQFDPRLFAGNKKDRDKAARERKAAQQEQARLLREQTKDQQAAQRQQHREAMKASKEQVKSLRTEAISSRVQAYSLASALGMPGYTIASAVDTMFIRPRENRKMEEQLQYQQQLDDYNRQVAADREQDKRASEEYIRKMPQDKGIKPPPPPPGAPPGGQQGGVPPINRPPRTPPTAPATPTQIPGQGLAMAAQGAVAAIQTLQTFNRGVKNVANQAGQFVTATNASQAAQAGANTAQSVLDPLGANVPLTIAVEGFNILLDLNKSILESVQANGAFAPQTLEASITRDLGNLFKQIELAQKLDGVTSELVNANAKFDLAFADFRAEIVQKAAPAIIEILELLTYLSKNGMNILEELPKILGSLLPGGTLIVQILTQILGKIDDATQVANDLDAKNIMGQIDKFFTVPNNLGKGNPRGPRPNP